MNVKLLIQSDRKSLVSYPWRGSIRFAASEIFIRGYLLDCDTSDEAIICKSGVQVVRPG